MSGAEMVAMYFEKNSNPFEVAGEITEASLYYR